MRSLFAASLLLAACTHHHTTAPSGWKRETIPFPLGFAPHIQHRGVEELQFAPGFFDPAAPGYWSYLFVWKTEDAARLDAPALAKELTAYFRGLLVSVDGDRHRIADPSTIVVRARPAGHRIELEAHIVDAFAKDAELHAVDLFGWAERRDCPRGALWTFVLAPSTTGVRFQLDELAEQAGC